MSLAEEYKRQFPWRDWPRAFAALPTLAGRTVLDLGCAIGDQAAELVTRGARVIGFDLNEDLLAQARARNLRGAQFHTCDLRNLPEGETVDGIWSSFAAAYFPALPPVLMTWAKRLRPGGWIALTEVEDLFGHEPLGDRARERFAAFARHALAGGFYDLHMGGKLDACLEAGGFSAPKSMTLADRELSFDGPALPEVREAWRLRFERMKLLRDFCGADFEAIRDEFLGCLTRDDHRSRAKVHFCLAILPAVA